MLSLKLSVIALFLDASSFSLADVDTLLSVSWYGYSDTVKVLQVLFINVDDGDSHRDRSFALLTTALADHRFRTV